MLPTTPRLRTSTPFTLRFTKEAPRSVISAETTTASSQLLLRKFRSLRRRRRLSSRDVLSWIVKLILESRLYSPMSSSYCSPTDLIVLFLYRSYILSDPPAYPAGLLSIARFSSSLYSHTLLCVCWGIIRVLLRLLCHHVINLFTLSDLAS